MRHWTIGIGLALAAAVGCAADATGMGDDDDSARGPCRRVEAFPLDVDKGCFSSKVTLSGVCLREEDPVTTSGSATDACLIGPDGNVYYVTDYGYTETLEGEGWNAYDLDQQVIIAPNEHDDPPFPPSCTIGRNAMNAAGERCVAQFDGDYEKCSGDSVAFTRAVESSCDSSTQDAGAR